MSVEGRSRVSVAEENTGTALKPQTSPFKVSVTKEALPRLAGWRRARGRSRKLTPARRWAVAGLVLLLMGVLTAHSLLQGNWGSQMLSLAGVGVLLVGAAALARWGGNARPQRSGALVPWLDGCPDGYGMVVAGLAIVVGACAGYLYWRSMDSWWLRDPSWARSLLAFALGCVVLLHLLPGRFGADRR